MSEDAGLACWSQFSVPQINCSIIFAKDDLLVHGHVSSVVALVRDLLAELVQGLHSGVSVRRGLVCPPVLLLEVAAVAHVVTEELGQVLRLTVSYCPFVVGGLPLGGSVSLGSLFWLLLLLFFFLTVWLSSLVFLFLLYFRFLNHVRSDIES